MYQINKGVDRPPEVLGIRGMNYLLYLAGGTVGGMVVATIAMLIGVPAMYAYGVMFVMVFLGYHKLASYSRMHGERGLSKFNARNRYPTVIQVRSTRPYRDMLIKREVKTSTWDRFKLKRN